MSSILYGAPLYLFTVLSLISIWYSYTYNQRMIDEEDYGAMLDPWKPVLLSWAVVTVYVLGVCVGQ